MTRPVPGACLDGGAPCGFCGAPMRPPVELGIAIQAALDAALEGLAKLADIDKEGPEAIARYAGGTLFPFLYDVSAELQGAHLACAAKQDEARRANAS